MEALRRGVRYQAVRILYDYISSLGNEGYLKVLNYGYYDGVDIPLDPQERPLRHRLALYHHLASEVDLEDKAVLEVSSGRGGGADYVTRHFNPRMFHGVDLSAKAVKYCREEYHDPRLSFSVGNAERLDLEDNSYDVVLNVEASHNYPDMDRFLSEVSRVLVPGGYFLFADMRPTSSVEGLGKSFREFGFKIVSEEDISSNVLSALDQDNDEKADFLKGQIPGFLWRPFCAFAGVKGTRFYNQLESGDLKYLSLVLQAP